MNRGPRSGRSPALTQCMQNSRGNIGRPYHLSFAIDPVARMRLVGGDQERYAQGVRMLDRVRARRPGQPLRVRWSASRPPPVGRTVDNDPS